MRLNIILLIALSFLLISYFIFIHHPNFANRNISSITLEFWNKLNFENKQTVINVNEKYWEDIVITTKKSKFSGFGTMFKKMNEPMGPRYDIKIKYKNNKEANIILWERVMYINNLWYELTNDSNKIFLTIDEIINEFHNKKN